eukprot:scaffold192_cov331-Pavlova_lutheri.AAC.3
MKGNDGYKLESFMFQKLNYSPWLLVRNASVADIIAVEVYPCDVSSPRDNHRRANDLLLKAALGVMELKAKRNSSADVLFVSSHDCGKVNCGFLASQVLSDGVMWLVNSADALFAKSDKRVARGLNLWKPWLDISAAPAVATLEARSRPLRKRGGNTLVYFSGTIHNLLRKQLSTFLLGKPGVRFLKKDKKFAESMSQSTFCLCPHGHVRGWTPRVAQSIWYGCIPVFFLGHTNAYFLPYYCLLDWSKLAIFIDPLQVQHTYEILWNVSLQTTKAMQEEILRIRPMFNYSVAEEGETISAFNILLVEMFARRQCNV